MLSISDRCAIAFRAASLDERLSWFAPRPAHGVAPGHAGRPDAAAASRPPEGHAATAPAATGPTANDMLSAWQQAFSPGDAEGFRRRLAWEGLDIDAIRAALADDAPPPRTAPAWTTWLLRFSQQAVALGRDLTSTGLPVESGWIAAQDEPPFLELWIPIVRAMRVELTAACRDLAGELTSPVRHAIERQWLNDLSLWGELAVYERFRTFDASSMASPAFDILGDIPFGPFGQVVGGGLDTGGPLAGSSVGSVRVAGDPRAGDPRAGDPRGEDPRGGDILSRAPIGGPSGRASAKYQAFIGHMLREGLSPLFQTHAVLARLLATIAQTGVDAAREFIVRLDSDREAIAERFANGHDPGPLVSLEPGLSDPHHGRRRVMAMQFANGLPLVYKPRDVAIERAWNDLLTWSRHLGMPSVPPVLRVLERDGYGWIEYARHEPLQSPDDVRDYYRRAGTLLFLTWLLGARDLHAENIVATRHGPVIVDAEMLLQPAGSISGAPPTGPRGEHTEHTVSTASTVSTVSVAQGERAGGSAQERAHGRGSDAAPTTSSARPPRARPGDVKATARSPEDDANERRGDASRNGADGGSLDGWDDGPGDGPGDGADGESADDGSDDGAEADATNCLDTGLLSLLHHSADGSITDIGGLRGGRDTAAGGVRRRRWTHQRSDDLGYVDAPGRAQPLANVVRLAAALARTDPAAPTGSLARAGEIAQAWDIAHAGGIAQTADIAHRDAAVEPRCVARGGTVATASSPAQAADTRPRADTARALAHGDTMVRPVERYTADLLQGFSESYDFVQERLRTDRHDRRRSPRAPARDSAFAGALLGFFDRCRVRVAFRSSEQYAALQRALVHPRFHRSGVLRSTALDALNRVFSAAPARPRVWPLVEEERRALERLDVPRFTARVDDTSVTPGGAAGPIYAGSGLEAARARLTRLSGEDLARQTALIADALRQSTTARFQNAPPRGEPTAWQASSASFADACRDHAVWIGRELLASAQWQGGGGGAGRERALSRALSRAEARGEARAEPRADGLRPGAEPGPLQRAQTDTANLPSLSGAGGGTGATVATESVRLQWPEQRFRLDPAGRRLATHTLYDGTTGAALLFAALHAVTERDVTERAAAGNAAACHAGTGHTATGHPATGHAAVGHAATGCATAGDVAAGHAGPGHPATGHGATGHSATGHAAAGRAATGRATAGTAAAGRAAPGRLATGHPATGHSATGDATVGRAATGHPATGHRATGHSATGHAAAGQAATGRATAGTAAAGRAAPGRLATGHPATGHSATDDAAPGHPATGHAATGRVATGHAEATSDVTWADAARAAIQPAWTWLEQHASGEDLRESRTRSDSSRPGVGVGVGVGGDVGVEDGVGVRVDIDDNYRRHVHADDEPLALGVTSGLGSLVYAFLVTGRLLRDTSYVDLAWRAAGLITRRRIAADDQFDLAGGAAGAIVALIALSLDDPNDTQSQSSPVNREPPNREDAHREDAHREHIDRGYVDGQQPDRGGPDRERPDDGGSNQGRRSQEPLGRELPSNRPPGNGPPSGGPPGGERSSSRFPDDGHRGYLYPRDAHPRDGHPAYGPQSRLDEQLAACADHLVAAQVRRPVGAAWPARHGGFHVGFAHGAAGIAWALMLAHARLGRDSYRQAAVRALAFERSQFVAARGNWPVLELSGPAAPLVPTWMHAWCHGAPGITLAQALVGRDGRGPAARPTRGEDPSTQVRTSTGADAHATSAGMTPTGVIPARGIPTDATPTSVTPTSVTPTDVTPTGVTARGATPSGAIPTGVTATGVAPTAVTATGVTARGATPSGAIPTGVTPSDVTPTGMAPTGVTATGATPSRVTPTGVTPTAVTATAVTATGATARGATPSGAIPTGVIPTGAAPTGVAPTGSLPPGLRAHGVTAAGLTVAGLTVARLTAASLTAASSTGADHLCCGNAGRAEILLTLGRLNQDPAAIAAARAITAGIVARARERGHFRLAASGAEYPIVDPGFFRGLSGIGYHLLRQAAPDVLPAVLAFDTLAAREVQPAQGVSYEHA